MTLNKLETLMTRVRQNPEDFESYIELAHLFIEYGKTNSAKDIFLHIKRIVPDHPKLEKLAEALGVFSPLVENDKNIISKNESKIITDKPLLQNQLISYLEGIDPLTDIDVAAEKIGTYLDKNYNDKIIRNFWWQFEKNHFKKLLRLCDRRDRLFVKKSYRVTCIVSTYNSAEFITECMEDLCNQTIFPDIEIIIIDASSQEDEVDRLAPYLARYSNIQYLITPSRIGIYPAWSFGCMLASAPYITPFSANDRLLPNAYEVLSSALENNPSATLVYGNSYLTDMPHQTIGSHSISPINNGFYIWPEITYGWLMLNCGVGPQPMWRASVHDKIGYFDRRYLAIGDQDFFLRNAREGSLMHVPEFTGMAWLTSDSLSGRPTALAEIFNIQLKHFIATIEYLEVTKRNEIRELFVSRYQSIAKYLISVGYEQTAVKLYEKHREFLNLTSFPP